MHKSGYIFDLKIANFLWANCSQTPRAQLYKLFKPRAPSFLNSYIRYCSEHLEKQGRTKLIQANLMMAKY